MTVSSRTRWAAGAVSTALNGLVILAVAGIGARGPDRVWMEDPMNVELVSVRGGDTQVSAPAAQAPPPHSEPAPEPPPSPSPAMDIPPRLTPEPEAAPSVRIIAEATSAPSGPPVSAAATAAARQAPAPLQRAGTRDGLDIDAPNGSSTDYASRLRAWLEAHKTYPKRSKMRREEGVVTIHFAVDRRGRLLGGDVTRSSGYAGLDAEAMAMLNRADPFPSAPHSVRGERIEISTPVEFSLQR